MVFEQVEAQLAHLGVLQEEADVPLTALVQTVPFRNAFDGFLEKDVSLLHELVVALVVFNHARKVVDGRVVDPIDGVGEEWVVEA